MAIENVPRCQHLKINGTQCSSPALRWRRHCFFHERIRRERTRIAKDTSAQRRFDLPLLEDANSVQVALMKVIQMLGCGRLEHKTAGLMLYALQTASNNLRNSDFEPSLSTDVVIDRDDVHRTIIGGQQWFKEDFEEDSEAEGEAMEDAPENEVNEVEDELDEPAPRQPGIAASPARAAALNPPNPKQAAEGKKEERKGEKGERRKEDDRKIPAPVKHLTTEEVRMQMKGVVRDWLWKTAAEQAGKPG